MVWMTGLLLALGTSCSKDMDETPARTIGQVTVNIASQSNLQTRTGLPVHNGEVDAEWVQGVQHVTDVYLYVFEQDEDKKDFTCRRMYDVGWSESVVRTQDGKLPTTTSSINYTIAYNFVVGKTYRLVAVGLDCAENVDEMQDFDGHNSALTYGLPESIQPGKKLSQAIVAPQVGMTTEDINYLIDRQYKPEDFMEYLETAPDKIVSSDNIPEGWQGVDIGPRTGRKFAEELKGKKTILWNGPLGVCEVDKYSIGTEQVAEAISQTDSISIVGGGDSAAAIHKLGLDDSFTHISTGGGASLELLEGKKLPGLECLNNREERMVSQEKKQVKKEDDCLEK